MSDRSKHLFAWSFVTVAVVVGLIGYIFGFARARPVTIATGGTTSVTLQTVAQLGYGPHDDWVSYLVQQPDGTWSHTSDFQVPAYSTVEVTILQYDNATAPRNPFFGKVIGTVGDTATVDGKTVEALDPATEVAHTFAVPNLGIYVPLAAVGDDAKDQCQVAPCTLEQAHRTVTFKIHTGAPGTFRWQCMIPCAAGFLMGWGGPMQTIGYMDGQMQVVAA